MFRPVTGAAALVLLAATIRAGAQSPPPPATPPPDNPVLCEFLVFNGGRDVTADASLRIYASGSRDRELTVEPDQGRLRISLAQGIYDVETFGREDGGIVAVKWIERIVVTTYPDEPNGHLEVVNFRPRFGAVQFVSFRGDAARDYQIQLFRADLPANAQGTVGDMSVQPLDVAAPAQVFVLPSGRYDVRIRRLGHTMDAPSGPEERWLRSMQIPTNRTQLTCID